MKIPAFVFSTALYARAKPIVLRSEPTAENRKRAVAAARIGKRRNKFERLLKEKYAAGNV